MSFIELLLLVVSLPVGSKFFQFHAVFGKIWQNHMLAPPGELGSLLREILIAAVVVVVVGIIAVVVVVIVGRPIIAAIFCFTSFYMDFLIELFTSWKRKL